MLIRTSRFGQVEIEPDDILRFPDGLFGLADYRHWVLLHDSENEALGWLQSTSRPDLAFGVVSPRRFVPDYQLRIGRRELARVAADDAKAVHLLVIVGRDEDGVTLNLKAPLVIHLGQRIGRQVVNNADEPVQYRIPSEPLSYRKSA
jgi:flagellar assembly factor FliW